MDTPVVHPALNPTGTLQFTWLPPSPTTCTSICLSRLQSIGEDAKWCGYWTVVGHWHSQSVMEACSARMSPYLRDRFPWEYCVLQFIINIHPVSLTVSRQSH